VSKYHNIIVRTKASWTAWLHLPHLTDNCNWQVDIFIMFFT